MNIQFIQANCVEGGKIDPRQAKAVKRYKPDLIFFEMPSSEGNVSSPFNTYSVEKKPFKKIEKIKEGIRKEAKKIPYALSDALVWDEIASLWAKGHNILLFNIDAPQELRRNAFLQYRHIALSRAKRQWQFWAYLCVRDTIMARHMEKVLKKYGKGKKLVAAVFLQSIHWQHVQFLLKNPSQKRIWDYYFGRFPKLTPDIVEGELPKENPILYRYWKEHVGKF